MRLIVAVCLGVLAAMNIAAWGPQGHMMVAAVAWKKLNPATKQEISRLLRENPNYEEWVAEADASEQDETAFVIAATWPDFIKGADGYVNDGEHPKGSAAGRNIGYSDMLQHRYWHFYDTPFSPDNTKLGKPDKVNALTQLRVFAKTLNSDASDDVRSYDLVWLLHIAGDIHQPLHATSRFDKADPKGDGGANRVHLCSAAQAAAGKKNCKANLHSFWDGTPGSGGDPSTAIKRADKLKDANTSAAANIDPQVWIDESFQLARSDVYTGVIQIGDGPFVLDPAYRANARAVASRQVALAGARLAALLNANVKTH